MLLYEQFYSEMLFLPTQLPSVLTVKSWKPLIQDMQSLSPEQAFQDAEYRVKATKVTLFCPLAHGDIIKIDGGYKYIVLYTQKMDDLFAYIHVACCNPSMHLKSHSILVVCHEMCDAPFPSQLCAEALAVIKDELQCYIRVPLGWAVL